ncbi:stress-responsive transcription factor hsf1 [Podila humilis]|nr:stress-responsive transcription factor hsf1 [Podila humilis]
MSSRSQDNNVGTPIITTPDSQDTLSFLNSSGLGGSHDSTTASMTDLMSPETRSALALINASHTANSIAAARGSIPKMLPLTGLTSSGQSTIGANVSTVPGLPSPSSPSAKTSSAIQPRSSNNSGRGNVAAFLTKLYNMVGDKASNNLIRWSDDGQSFLVINHVEFAKEVLPRFFKHNNFSSFVRQLNMYGFHKVPHLQQGVLMPDPDSEQWEFSNQHFQRNQPDLLYLVSRKKASNGSEDKDALTMDLGHILSEVTAIKRHQIAISSDLKNIESDHRSLWQESLAARERHQRQQETIDKILRFLASVFSGEKKRAIVPNKKPRLTITEGHGNGSDRAGGMFLEEEEDDDLNSEHLDGLRTSISNFQQTSVGDHEEEVTNLLGSSPVVNKGKRDFDTMAGSSSATVSEAHVSEGASVTNGVDQITQKMEQLQKDIEALQQYGLNVNDLNFDDNSYMAPVDHYGTADFLSTDQFQYPVTSSNNATSNPGVISNTNFNISDASVGLNSRISTVGEEEYLEGLLDLDNHS